MATKIFQQSKNFIPNVKCLWATSTTPFNPITVSNSILLATSSCNGQTAIVVSKIGQLNRSLSTSALKLTTTTTNGSKSPNLKIGKFGRSLSTSAIKLNSTDSSSSSSATGTDKINDSDIKKSVFISQSNDIFTNLALEDWLYKNFDFSHHHVLMLWTNDPCVVIGRHQNPFIEANVTNLMNKGITLARRNSGGGAVYHDRGNLNCTFFTPRQRYNRKYNLKILTRAIYREYGIKTEINDRDDIVIGEKKISGTAAKLGQPNAYHHCTLLVNSNKLHVTDSLVKDEANYISKATSSKRSKIKNLSDVNKIVNVPQTLSAIGYEFLRTSATELHDGGREQAMNQRGFQLINPTEKWFPGITEIRDLFKSWDWCIGKTPKFSVEKEIMLKSSVDKEHKIILKVDVDKGLIADINLMLPTSEEPIPVVSGLLTKPYSEDCLHQIVSALKLVSTTNVKQAMNGM